MGYIFDNVNDLLNYDENEHLVYCPECDYPLYYVGYIEKLDCWFWRCWHCHQTYQEYD